MAWLLGGLISPGRAVLGDLSNEPQLPSADELRRKLHVAAIALLVLGFVLAAVTYLSIRNSDDGNRSRTYQRSETPRADAPLAFEDSKRDNRQLELYYGKVGVLTMKWQQRWITLKEHPVALAVGILLISSLLASFCFWLENRIPDDSK